MISDDAKHRLEREARLIDTRRRETEERIKKIETAAKRGSQMGLKRELPPEEESAAKKQKITSTVALPGGQQQSLLHSTDQPKPDDGAPKVPEHRKQRLKVDGRRDKKLLGLLQGHLNKSRMDYDNRGDRVKRHEETWKRIETTMVQTSESEKEKALAQLDEEKTKQTSLLGALEKRHTQLTKAQTRITKEEREVLLSHFLETKTTPHLFFLPSHHTIDTRRRVEDRKAAAFTKFEEFRRQLDSLMQDIDKNGIEKIMPTRHSGLDRPMPPRPDVRPTA